jgi:hypothetical protein
MRNHVVYECRDGYKNKYKKTQYIHLISRNK